MRFVKMHGCGNDFVVVDGPCAPEPSRVRALCDRRHGIGADGVIVVGPRVGERWPVIVHNADGSIADACGNGYRCVARYLFERDGGDETILATPGGDVRAWRDGTEIAIDLAAPVLDGRLALDGRAGRRVSVGNPNVVVYVDDPERIDLEALAASARVAVGPANVEAVTVRGPRELSLRVHERGAGETLACGTGSCAAVAAALADGHLESGTIAVRLRGGTLRVTPRGERYTLTGPAERVFEGTVS